MLDNFQAIISIISGCISIIIFFYGIIKHIKSPLYISLVIAIVAIGFGVWAIIDDDDNNLTDIESFIKNEQASLTYPLPGSEEPQQTTVEGYISAEPPEGWHLYIS